MKYKKALEFVHSIPKFRRPLGNANLRRLLECLEDPQDKLRFIHIAGTNGKGSTAAMIAAALRGQGYRIGLFTSPYIEKFNERIQINNTCISNETLSEYIWFVKDTMEKSDAPVSEFAFITVVAMLYFANMKCDFVVLETGLGGTYDATNVIDESVVSVITSIGLDHTQYLGGTIEEIAEEKCGIIKKYGTVVSEPNKEVIQIIEADCRHKNARLIISGKAERTKNGISYKNEEYPLNLKGEYQLINSAVALEVLFAMRGMGIKISDEAIKEGFKKVSWNARFEFVKDNAVIDGAHNIDAMKALCRSLRGEHSNVIAVFAMMEDKNYEECIRELSRCARKIIVTELDMPRCVKAQTLAGVRGISCAVTAETNVKQAIELAMNEANDGEIVCVCGSLYLAGEARKILKNN